MGATKSRSRGYVEQRSSGSYRAVIYAGLDPLTGKERYLRESAPTRKAAQAAVTVPAGASGSRVTRAPRGR